MKKENLDKIIRLRHHLHQHPELSLKEQQTIQILKDFFKVNTSFEIIDMGRWFYAAKYASQGETKKIAFRADMDALPIDERNSLPYASSHEGISHKCGHDGHCAALCGLAMELDQITSDKTVYLIFQHAEEIGGGGEECASLIKEKGISEIYAFHNLSGYHEGEVIIRRGLTQPASEGLSIRFYGKQSHASEPELGINPSKAVATTVLYSQELMNKSFQGMVLCTITGIHVGTGDFGISPGEGSINMTLRAEREEEMKKLEKNILHFASEQAKTGLSMEYEISDYFPETRNHELSTYKVIGMCKRTGYAFLRNERTLEGIGGFWLLFKRMSRSDVLYW